MSETNTREIRNHNHMPIYTLQIDRNDKDMSWGFIPDSLWKTILNEFVIHHVNGIGFVGITHKDDISKIAGFDNWQPDIKHNCRIETVIRTPSNVDVKQTHDLAVFPYSAQMQHIILSARFSEWKVTDDDYPVDYLYFFKDADLVMEAIPYESTIVFHITPSQYVELLSIDTLIEKSLYEHTSISVKVTLL